MISKLLIANRGEIAIRIARTAADYGVETVAVFTSDDETSLHRRYADEATVLPKSGVAGYLDIEALITIAQKHGCDAIHPGYGLLSERTPFAEACEAAGLIFVGPSSEALRVLGDKAAARKLAEEAGVPVIPGLESVASADALRTFFNDQGGRSIMVKAIHGGGGRGMRVVRSAEEIESAFDLATSEAMAAFGSGDLYAERYLPKVRHVEVQIVGDGSDIVHLFERDCSVQRRHQKVIEIAPAPNLAPTLRDRLAADAVRIGEAIGYRGIGTVEFLVDVETGEHVFMETNPRIQVEHTITEEITGLDLVAIQLELASGKRLADLGLTQAGITYGKGYAIQLRLNAETVGEDGGLMPVSGTVTDYIPASGPGLRVDSYLYPGYATNPQFDNLLAKVIVRSPSDSLAHLFAKADRALSECQIGGIKTNLSMLRNFLKGGELPEWDVHVAGLETALLQAAAKDIERESRTPVASRAGEGAAPPSDEPTLPAGFEAIRCPMQAMVSELPLSAGSRFGPGDELVVVEAMKMQHAVSADKAGTIREILVQKGEVAKEAQALLIIDVDDADETHADAEEAVDLDHIRPDLQKFFDRAAFTLDENRPDAVKRRHGRGQRTARENVGDIISLETFVEYGQLTYAAQRTKFPREELMKKSPGDGVVAGLGAVSVGQDTSIDVAILAYDGSVFAGTQGAFGHHKTDRLFDVAGELHVPIIFLAEGGGGRPNDVDFQEIARCGLDVTTFHHFARHKSAVPNITMVSGFCFAGNAAVFGAGDIKIATRNSWIGLGGPAMIEGGGLGVVQPTDIGPSAMQAQNGLIDILVEDDAEACTAIRNALSFFSGPQATWEAADERLLRHAVPENRKRIYDMRVLIKNLADKDGFLELRPDFAAGMITGLVRIEGHAMGLIANNPGHLGGAVDALASKKAAEFLMFCERFRLPVLSLCDTPGFMVGPASEQEGGVKEACAFIRAGAELTTPLIFVCTRKGYGIGAQAMAGGTFVKPAATLAWPTGEFGPMGLEGSVRLGFKRELEAAPTKEAGDELFEQMVAHMYEEGHALNIASLLEIDGVIDPAQTRRSVVRVLTSHQKKAAV